MTDHPATRRDVLRAAVASAVAMPVLLPTVASPHADAGGWDIGPFVKHKEPILAADAGLPVHVPDPRQGSPLGGAERLQPGGRGARRQGLPALPGGRPEPGPRLGPDLPHRHGVERGRHPLHPAPGAGPVSRQRRVEGVRVGRRLRGPAHHRGRRRRLLHELHHVERQAGYDVRGHLPRPGPLDQARAGLPQGRAGQGPWIAERSGRFPAARATG